MMQQDEKHLLQLVFAKENAQLQQIKKQFTQFTKYFFNIRSSTTIAYDRSILYVIHKDSLKIIDLGKVFPITDLVYNYEKHIVVFLTTEGHLYIHFASSKTQIQIKKDFKRILVMEWIYSVPQTANLFIAQEAGVHLYRVQQQKRTIKQVKHVSGKYHCFLYEPFHQFLAGIPYGYCDAVFIFHFDQSKAKSWFRSGEIDVNFTKEDDIMTQRIKEKKSIGLQGSRISKQIFANKSSLPQDYFIDIQHINNTPYLFFYYSNEGKLKLTPLVQSDQKQIIIKLPSDSIPSFNIVDNMLVVHLKNQKITFIYDVNYLDFQALVSPYPLIHQDSEMNASIYKNEFIGKRILHPTGKISKWKVSIPVIYHYLKSQMHIFQFLIRRSNSKMQIIKWMRSNLFLFKQINLSKMWKSMFAKIKSNLYDDSEVVSIVQIYSNLFYTLYIEPLVNKQILVNIMLQCIRQANQYKIVLPEELQTLVVQLLLDTQKYDLLAYVSHHLTLNANHKIFKLIYNKGLAQNNDLLLSISIDLANQCIPSKQVLRMIMKSQRLRQGKRFIKNNFQKMDALDFLEAAKYIQNNQLKKEFVVYVRLFITIKFPNINQIYLDEAQQKLLT